MRKIPVLAFAILLGALPALATTNQVDINMATKQQLESVKGINAAKANAIIDYRTRNGNFSSVNDLNKVPGFTEKNVENLQGSLIVSNQTSAATPHNGTTNISTPANNAMTPNVSVPGAENNNPSANDKMTGATTANTSSINTPASTSAFGNNSNNSQGSNASGSTGNNYNR